MNIHISRIGFKNTTEVPSSFLREVVRFVKPANSGRIGIWFKRARGPWFAGTCWNHTQIRCRIPSPHILKRPYDGCTRAGYLPWGAATWEEGVVAIVAHEIRHAWQYRNPRGRRVWGAKGRSSERDCDAYAIRMMREWRRVKPSRVVARVPGASLARYRIMGAKFNS